MNEFDEHGKSTKKELYWSLLSDGKIKEVNADLLDFLVKQEP